MIIKDLLQVIDKHVPFTVHYNKHSTTNFSLRQFKTANPKRQGLYDAI